MKNERKWPIPRRCSRADVMPLIKRFHAYKSLGQFGELWACFSSEGEPLAAFAWQPPPHAAAKSVSPGCPTAVLSLSRMVAVPKAERDWHISKPLRWLMRKGIDRSRWPVLLTYADTGAGHSGHVYVCSGWKLHGTSNRIYYVDGEGRRQARYTNGGKLVPGLKKGGTTVLKRFVHRICPAGEERQFLIAGGWQQIETGRVWRSGNRAKKWVRYE